MILLVATAGALGAVVRHLAVTAFGAPPRAGIPVGVFAVNVVGAFGAGWAAAVLDLGSPVGVGVVAFLSGFTTFSTWMVDTVGLGITRLDRRAIANLVVTLVLGLVAAAGGFAAGGGSSA